MHRYAFVPLLAPLLTLALASCQTPLQENASAHSTADPANEFAKGTPEWRGLKFARNRCADCHAVTPGEISPNPSSPDFEAVANAPGLTRQSLTNWLNTSHDFPREMYFAIPEESIDDLAAYMLTLRRKDYEPPT